MTPSPSPFRAARLALAAGLALALTGCASRGFQARSDIAEVPDDYRERHPVVIGDVKKSLDVFLVANAGIDHRQAEDIRAFVKTYRASGKGALVAALPQGAPAGAVRFTLREIRRVAGVPGMIVAAGETHPTAASIRLSFAALDARVASRCGQWPFDMAGGPTTQSWANRPYYNLGCSYQTMMAAQAANPMDHIRPRQEGPYDLERRLADIKDVRENKDPSTKWPVETTKINQSLQ
mgnify:CR=1 FL=1